MTEALSERRPAAIVLARQRGAVALPVPAWPRSPAGHRRPRSGPLAPRRDGGGRAAGRQAQKVSSRHLALCHRRDQISTAAAAGSTSRRAWPRPRRPLLRGIHDSRLWRCARRMAPERRQKGRRCAVRRRLSTRPLAAAGGAGLVSAYEAALAQFLASGDYFAILGLPFCRCRFCAPSALAVRR
jgi:hypothetical protein